MKTRTLLLTIACIALAFTSITALYAAGEADPVVAPAAVETQAAQDGIVVGADPLGLFDPLAGAVQTACTITCADAFRECRSSCGGQIVCVDSFICDNADPCSYECYCTSSCPPSP